MSDPESMTDGYEAQLGICHECITSLKAELADRVPRSRVAAMELEIKAANDRADTLFKRYKEHLETLEAELSKLREENERAEARCLHMNLQLIDYVKENVRLQQQFDVAKSYGQWLAQRYLEKRVK